MIGDKNYFGADFEATLEQAGIELLRPARKGERPRPGARFFKPLRQIIESINDTFKVTVQVLGEVIRDRLVRTEEPASRGSAGSPTQGGE